MKHLKLFLILSLAVFLTACGERPEFQIGELLNQNVVQVENEEPTVIKLSGDTAEIEGEGAEIGDGVLLISRGGVYKMSGEFKGTVVVEATKADRVELIFDGVSISSENAAVYVKCVDKVTVTLADGSENHLSDGEEYALDNNYVPSACLYSADDITIRGGGKLTVEANCRNGIQTKNDLRIKGGEITVTAAKNAFKGKDNVEISGGVIKVLGASDAIKSDNETEEGRGNVVITGGTIQLKCQDDAIQAFRSVKISGCVIEIASGDKHVNCDGEVDVEEDCIKELVE